MLLDNIKVCVRVRPLGAKELEVSDLETIKIIDQESLSMTPPLESGIKQSKKNFKFNWVFSRLASQKDIFDATLEYQCLCVLDGYNYTFFSYGASESGKSHTIMKMNEDYGLMIRSLNKIFSQIQSKKRKIQVLFTYLEIFQENLSDLLNNTALNLEIREDPVKGVFVNGAREVEVNSTQETLNLINYGKKNKNTKTKSHEILILTFMIHDSPGITNDVTVSKLIIGDLSSLERGAQKNQNISLLSLRSCIQSLSEAQAKHTQPYIPYRNSKLTRMLKESLGGNSKTLMISCVNSGVIGFEESLQTLETSTLAMGIYTSTTVKTIQQDEQSQNFQQIIEQLRSENKELKKILNTKQPIENNSNLYTEDDLLKYFSEQIIDHFNNEQDVNNQHFTYSWEKELLGYKILENQTNLESIDGIDRIQAEKIRIQLEIDKNQLEKYEQHIIGLNNQQSQYNEQRNAVIENIATSQLSETSKLYLNSLIKQHVLKMENIDIKHKEDLNILQKQQSEREMAILRSQINLRDQIITNQKQHIHNHLKTNSLQHFSQVNTTTEVIEGNKAKIKHYPLPKIKDHYFNQQAYISSKKNLSPIVPNKLSSPRLKTPLQLQKQPYVPRVPNVKLIDQLSTPQFIKNKLTLPLQKPIKSTSMVSLPFLKPNRSISKFVYDWRSGGYKFVDNQSALFNNNNNYYTNNNSRNLKTSTRDLDKALVNSNIMPNSLERRMLTSRSSGGESRQSPNRYTQHKLLLPGNVHESPYVKGFINNEIQRKYKLFQLNEKIKKVQKKQKK